MVLSRLPVLHYFYSRPPHGGRLRSSCLIEYFWNFYPRPHMEGDCAGYTSLAHNPISTHALTWRATSDKERLYNIWLDFYPRPHMEGDFILTLCPESSKYFYPRPHMEGDYSPKRPLGNCLDFYPRPHMEGDAWSLKNFTKNTISTHALTWRATQLMETMSCLAGFLPTPSHGGRHSTHPG